MSRAAEEALLAAAYELHDLGLHKDAKRAEEFAAELRDRRSRPFTPEEMRDAVLQLRRFTISEICSEVGRSRATVQKALGTLAKRGIVQREAQPQRHKGAGRPAVVWAYVEPPSGYVKREKRPPPEKEMASKLQQLPQAPKQPHRRKLRISNPEIRELAKAGRAAGWTVEPTSGGHYWLAPPDSSTAGKILLPKTPSDYRAVLNVRAEMRKAGIAV